jgi:hypothetical protein
VVKKVKWQGEAEPPSGVGPGGGSAGASAWTSSVPRGCEWEMLAGS